MRPIFVGDATITSLVDGSRSNSQIVARDSASRYNESLPGILRNQIIDIDISFLTYSG